jgi:ABC-type antimicrobial peptide transport system permease subunit
MHIKLTQAFFMKEKGQFLWSVGGIAFLIGVYLFLNASLGMQKSTAAVPDLLFMGTVEDRFAWVYADDFETETIAASQTELADYAEIVLATQRFLYTDEDPLAGQVNYYVLGLPQTFMDTQLSQLVIAGRAPEGGKAELIAGASAARLFEIDVGDVISMTLDADAQTALIDYRVVGILDTKAHDFYDRALFVSADTYAALAHNAIGTNALFIFLKAGLSTGEFHEIVNRTFAGKLGFNSAQLKGVHPGRFMQIVSSAGLIALICLTLSQSLQVMLQDATRHIGLLKTLGMNDGAVVGVFALGILTVFGLALLIGLGLTTVAFHSLNQHISTLLRMDIQLYRLSGALLLPLLALLLFTLVLALVWVYYQTRCIPPRRALLDY